MGPSANMPGSDKMTSQCALMQDGAHCVFQKDGHFLVYRCGEDGRVSTDPDDCVWTPTSTAMRAPSTVAGAACRTMATSSSMTARAVLCGALAPTVASRATAPAASTGSSKCVQLASVH